MSGLEARRRNALEAPTGVVSSSSVSNTMFRPGSPRALIHPLMPSTESAAGPAKAPVSDATTPILKSLFWACAEPPAKPPRPDRRQAPSIETSSCFLPVRAYGRAPQFIVRVDLAGYEMRVNEKLIFYFLPPASVTTEEKAREPRRGERHEPLCPASDRGRARDPLDVRPLRASARQRRRARLGRPVHRGRELDAAEFAAARARRLGPRGRDRAGPRKPVPDGDRRGPEAVQPVVPAPDDRRLTSRPATRRILRAANRAR